MYFSAAHTASAAIKLTKNARTPVATTVFMHTSLGYDSRIAERVNVSRVPCGFHIRLVDPAISPVSCVGDPKPGLRESGIRLSCPAPCNAERSQGDIDQDHQRLRTPIKTEIPRLHDEARAFAPETRRLWRDLLSVHIDRAEMSPVIELGWGAGGFSELVRAHFGF